MLQRYLPKCFCPPIVVQSAIENQASSLVGSSSLSSLSSGGIVIASTIVLKHSVKSASTSCLFPAILINHEGPTFFKICTCVSPCYPASSLNLLHLFRNERDGVSILSIYARVFLPHALFSLQPSLLHPQC